MSDDPNKKHNEGIGYSEQQSGQKPGQQSEQWDNPAQSQKRPSQGGNEGEKDDKQSEQDGQRRAS
jgi:hypothetical protein